MTATVVLTRTGVLRLRGGHPWIYPKHVAEVDRQAAAGLVRLEGPRGRARGEAIYSPDSGLPIRVVSTDAESDLAGSGDAWWHARLDRAIERRAGTLAVGEPACRWVHAEADGLAGLVVDRYADVAVLQAGCRWADELAPAVARRLLERHGVRGVLARHDGGFRDPEGLTREVVVLAGEVPESVAYRSGGIERVVDPRGGQKTGAFLDQRENRAAADRLLPAGRALDAFCYDGGFAVRLARGDRDVEAWDSSAPALARAEEHAARNGVAARVQVRRVNVFDALRAALAGGERYDAIVLDPPALAKRRGQLSRALRAYRDLNRLALGLLADGGRLMTCSCSAAVDAATFMGMLGDASAEARRPARVVETRAAAACHPHRVAFPESAYLSVVVLEAFDDARI